MGMKMHPRERISLLDPGICCNFRIGIIHYFTEGETEAQRELAPGSCYEPSHFLCVVSVFCLLS